MLSERIGFLGTGLGALLAICAGAGAQAQSGETFDCLIEPHSVADVSTREEGVLEEILVQRGDIVSKGQVVARLESGLERATLELARARAEMMGEVESREAALEYARRQRDRIDELFAENAISFNDKDQAETELLLAQSELQIAQDNLRLMQIERERVAHQLELRSIRSPVDGVIVEILLVPGESVEDRAREIMTIAELDPLNVEVILPGDRFGTVQVGSAAEIQPLLPGVEARVAEVTVVDRTIDAASDTFGVRLQLENRDYSLPGGIRCDIEFLPGPDVASVR